MSTPRDDAGAERGYQGGAERAYDDACRRGNLTRRQLLVYAGARFAAGRSVFTEGAAFHVYGGLDVARFARAWRRVVAESDALRSVFTEREGWPRREVRSGPEPELEVVDLRGSAAPAAALDDLTRARFERCGRADGALVESVLVRLAPEHHVWVLVQHQLVSDAWSFRVVHARMDAHYRRDADVRDDVDVAPPFALYVAHERELWESARRAAAARHWDACYAGSVGSSVPAGRAATRIARVVQRLGAARSTALRRLGAAVASSDVGVFAVTAGIATAHVHGTTGARDVVLSVPFANRPSARFKRTIGSFMNVCPVRVRLERTDRFRDVLARVAAATWEAARHQWYVQRPGRIPQPYDLFVNVARSAVAGHTFADRPMDVVWLAPTHRFGAVLMSLHDFGDTGELSMVFDFNATLFSAGARGEFVASLLRTMDAGLADPERRLEAIAAGGARADAPRATPGVRTAPEAGVPVDAADAHVDAADARRIAAVWAALLEVPAVRVSDDFFVLGGNSLLVYRMLPEIERAFGVDVPADVFLADPTVAGLARLVAERRRPAAELEAMLRDVEALSDGEATALLAEDSADARAEGRRHA